MTVLAVVLCGGASRRFGRKDKTRQPLGTATVLDHLLAGLPADWAVVCVGEARPTGRAVRWTREEPRGGGPVAGIAAALAPPRPERPREHRETTVSGAKDPENGGLAVFSSEDAGGAADGAADEAGADRPGVVVVLAGDMPFAAAVAARLAATLVDRLRPRTRTPCTPAAPTPAAAATLSRGAGDAAAADPAEQQAAGQDAPGHQGAPAEAVVAVTDDGRVQPLLAAYRRTALEHALPEHPAGARAMALLDRLRWVAVRCEDQAALDVDTPTDLALARRSVQP